MSVTYTAVLPVAEDTVLFVSRLLAAERRRRGTRGRRRALGCYRQAVLVLRWFLDDTRLAQLAADNAIGRSTAYRYLHEGIDVLAAAAPGLRGALLAARAAGHAHVTVDGTLIRTDRCHVPGPTARTDRSGRQVDLWWSGKHHHHGGNVQVVTAPDGWPLWVSDVRPGREHDVTCARTHTELLDVLDGWSDAEHAVLADLGYHGEADRLTCPIKKPAKPARLTSPSAPSTCCTLPPARWPNAGTPCSRPPSRRCAGSACVRGGSVRSPPPRSSCSTPNTTGRRDHAATEKDSLISRSDRALQPRPSVRGAPKTHPCTTPVADAKITYQAAELQLLRL